MGISHCNKILKLFKSIMHLHMQKIISNTSKDGFPYKHKVLPPFSFLCTSWCCLTALKCLFPSQRFTLHRRKWICSANIIYSVLGSFLNEDSPWTGEQTFHNFWYANVHYCIHQSKNSDPAESLPFISCLFLFKIHLIVSNVFQVVSFFQVF